MYRNRAIDSHIIKQETSFCLKKRHMKKSTKETIFLNFYYLRAAISGSKSMATDFESLKPLFHRISNNLLVQPFQLRVNIGPQD